MENNPIRRGEIYIADLSPHKGSEQGGERPVVILQNNKGNRYSTTTIIAPITSKRGKYLPTHVDLGNCGYCLENNSRVLLEQVRVIDKCRLRKYICSLYSHEMERIEQALLVSVGIEQQNRKS